MLSKSPHARQRLVDSTATAAPHTLACEWKRGRLSGAAMGVITLHVPGMTRRSLVRVLTARVRDLPGVQTVEANADTAVLIVHGTATERQGCAPLAEAGFPAGDQAEAGGG